MHFHGLDALRGFAALGVAFFHLSGNRFGYSGYMLVHFFLVLSGFVLAHSYMYRETPIGKWEFTIRRFARLWPMHVAAIFIMYGGIRYPLYGTFFSEPGSVSHNTWGTLIQNLTLTHHIGLPPTGPYVWTWNLPSWSISIEFWVNILFILLITKATKSGRLFVLSTAFLALVLYKSGSTGDYNSNYFAVVNSGLVLGIASFVLGLLSYRLYIRYQHIKLGSASATILECGSIALMVLFLKAAHLGIPALEILAPYFYALMIPLFTLELGLISRSTKGLKYLGTISYSVYLNHMAIWILFSHRAISPHFSQNGKLATEICVLLVYSHFTFQYIERPSQRFLLKRLLPRNK